MPHLPRPDSQHETMIAGHLFRCGAHSDHVSFFIPLATRRAGAEPGAGAAVAGPRTFRETRRARDHVKARGSVPKPMRTCARDLTRSPTTRFHRAIERRWVSTRARGPGRAVQAPIVRLSERYFAGSSDPRSELKKPASQCKRRPATVSNFGRDPRLTRKRPALRGTVRRR